MSAGTTRAYCEWLGTVRDQVVRLPTEAEWEKAPHNGRQGRNYPSWGAKASRNRANYGDTGINGTSPVGCFPNGKSSYGCYDLAGNIDEWTEQHWDAISL